MRQDYTCNDVLAPKPSPAHAAAALLALVAVALVATALDVIRRLIAARRLRQAEAR